MKRFIEGVDRFQSTLFPEYLEDWIDTDNPVRVIDAFVEQLDLLDLGFERVDPKATGRPSYHPSVLLKLYIYGYLNRVQSSRRLEREAGRNVEMMWLACLFPPRFNRKRLVLPLDAGIGQTPQSFASAASDLMRAGSSPTRMSISATVIVAMP